MTKVTYELSENENGSTVVIRKNLDNSFTLIPLDKSNSDYQQYLASLEANKTETE
jgi:hypothetical protein